MERIPYKKLNKDLRDMRKLARYSGYRCRNLSPNVHKIGCVIRGSDNHYYIGVNHQLEDRVISAEESALIFFLNAADSHVKVRSVFISYDPDIAFAPMDDTRHLFYPFLESPSTRVFMENGRQVTKFQFDEWE